MNIMNYADKSLPCKFRLMLAPIEFLHGDAIFNKDRISTRVFRIFDGTAWRQGCGSG